MNSQEGVPNFFEYKKSVERERPLLTAESRLITIDGVDGTGKSTIAKKLAKKLQERFGEDKVILVSATNLSGSPKREKLGALAKLENITSSRLETIYIAGVNRAYEEVIVPALRDGKIVIADRSEVDLLRYAIWRDDKESIQKRVNYIQDGTVTHRLWAGNRIFLESDPNNALANLKLRKHKSLWDPLSPEEAEKNAKAQKEVEKQIESMSHQGEVKITREKVLRVEDETKREKYLDELVDRLSTGLNLTEKKAGGK